VNERLVVKLESSIGTVAFLGNYLPHKCGMGTLTSDLLGAVARTIPKSQCSVLSINDIKGGYEYAELVALRLMSRILNPSGVPLTS